MAIMKIEWTLGTLGPAILVVPESLGSGVKLNWMPWSTVPAKELGGLCENGRLEAGI